MVCLVMKQPVRPALVFAILLSALTSVWAESRMWTSADGKHIQAELVDVLNGEAVLRVPGQANLSRVPFARLSLNDQEYIKGWVKPGAPPPKTDAPKKPGSKPDPEAKEETEIKVDATGFPIGNNSSVKRSEHGWPEVVALLEKPTFTVFKEDKKENVFIYQSDHFEFHSSQRLSGEIVREFSRLFETTYEMVVALPLRLNPKPPAGFFRVKLFATTEEYFTAGGLAGSAGVYMGRTKEVMVPLPYLGVKQIGERWILDDRDGNHTLVHEVVHQVMHDWLNCLPVWVTEGIAEYITAGRYAAGRITLRGYGNNMNEYKNGGSRGGGHTPLDKLMEMDSNTWAGALAGGAASRNYRSAMLLFYYFCHEDDDKTGKKLIEYFAARRQQRGDEDKEDREEYLIRGRDPAALQKDFKRGLASVGVRLD